MTMLRSWFIKEVVGLELDYMQVDGDMEGPASVREVDKSFYVHCFH